MMHAEPVASDPLDASRLDRWLWSRARREWLTSLRAAMTGCSTRVELEAAPFWRREGPRLDRLMTRVQTGAPGTGRPPWQSAWPEAPPRGGGRAEDLGCLRLVHWNILKGIAFAEILAVLEENSCLRSPDILLLNEIDVGMARSGNRHVAAELGARLGMHWAFLPNYLELTKGPGREADAPGENRIGLHGLAILTRRPPRRLRPAPLPECFDMFAFAEKRYGRRAGLLALPASGPVVGSVHLEVRGTPACRARQMGALLATLERELAAGSLLDDPPRTPAVIGAGTAGGGILPPSPPVVLGGDLNTHTFVRGSLGAKARGYLRILRLSRDALAQQLSEPWRAGREPLFGLLERHGFAWAPFNDCRPTAAEMLGRIEEVGGCFRGVQRAFLAPLGGGSRRIPLRLDWFAGRGVTLAADAAPVTVGEPSLDDVPSDHLPITLDIAWPTGQPD
ncbi:MAG: endonuclease/exonuclease/phosphatase family protein [Candidatus Eisenbacteria sp.]|nr:endonuclease/exonuclease/phosphatase family protein [Candidatus Eisenbacteria bacterium]